METIITYVNNIFGSLPATPELTEVKENITNNMIEKYQELKAEGHSENEAVGIVISEFGNIEELLQELGINYDEAQNSSISFDMIKDFLHIKDITSILITLGVALCLFGATLCVLFDTLAEQSIFCYFLDSSGSSILGIAGLFVCVALAVGLFIYAGYLTKPFDFLKQGILLDGASKEYLMQKKDSEEKGNTICVIAGVALCILSPVVYCIMEYYLGNDNDLATIPMLLLILVAVSLLVYSGCKSSAINTLLSTPKEVLVRNKKNNLYSAINGSIMMSAAAIYLVLGFLYNCWISSVIVFIIGTILCVISSAIINACTQNK